VINAGLACGCTFFIALKRLVRGRRVLLVRLLAFKTSPWQARVCRFVLWDWQCQAKQKKI